MFEKLEIRQREKAEEILREALSRNGIGLFVVHLKNHDRINAYPTRNSHIHKISLTLRGRLDMSVIVELLRDHLLSVKAFGIWNAEQWDLDSPKLWEENKICPWCGAKADQSIRSAETGLSYCSMECAKKDVRAKTPDGGW